MTALKPAETEGFITRPDLSRRLILIYGPDTGLVSERTQALVKAHLGVQNDPFALVRLDGDQLASDPMKLADEAYTMALFGGQRVIWIKAGSKPFNPALLPLFADMPPNTSVFVEAGNLKNGHALRKAFEDHRQALAIPCFNDGDVDIHRLIDTELKKANLTIEQEARELLAHHLGGDRLASKQEINKLCLYCYGGETITVTDVQQSVGDVSQLSLDELLDAMALGHIDHVVSYANRLLTEGGSASVLCGQALRHMSQLQLARSEIDKGKTTLEALRVFVPPIFYKRKTNIERQLNIWSLSKLDQAISTLMKAYEETRKNAHLAHVLLERTLIAIALQARPKR